MDHLKSKDSQDPDFPKKGILLLRHHHVAVRPPGLAATQIAIAAPYMGEDINQVDRHTRAADSSSVPPCADALGCQAFCRSENRASCRAQTQQRDVPSLESDDNALEIHQDTCANGQQLHVHSVDDVLATGGTGKSRPSIWREKPAARSSASQFLIELDFFNRPLETGGRAGLFCVALLIA